MDKESIVKVKTGGIPVADSLKYRLVSDAMINLTRTKAFEILELDTFSAERPVREHWVQHLYDEWIAGRFLWHQAMIAYGLVYQRGPDGKTVPHTYRLNGQHTCWMRVSIPKDKDPGVCRVRQLVYECQNLEGLREIYAVIDRNAGRTNAHITKVLLADMSDLSSIPLSYMNGLVAGFKSWLWESPWDRHHKGNPQEVAALINGKFSALFRIVGTYFQIKYSEWPPIRRAGVVAALFATFDKAGGAAPEFWDNVCSGLNFNSKADPRYQLRQFLDAHPQNLMRGGSYSAEDTYRICINMWNRWRKEEPVTVVRTTDTRVKPS